MVTKKLDIAYKIIHLILKYQKYGDVTIINDSQVKLVNKKICYFGLQEKQPNFLGNARNYSFSLFFFFLFINNLQI